MYSNVVLTCLEDIQMRQSIVDFLKMNKIYLFQGLQRRHVSKSISSRIRFDPTVFCGKAENNGYFDIHSSSNWYMLHTYFLLTKCNAVHDIRSKEFLIFRNILFFVQQISINRWEYFLFGNKVDIKSRAYNNFTETSNR